MWLAGVELGMEIGSSDSNVNEGCLATVCSSGCSMYRTSDLYLVFVMSKKRSVEAYSQDKVICVYG